MPREKRRKPRPMLATSLAVCLSLAASELFLATMNLNLESLEVKVVIEKNS